jgi:hypothetical protein
MNAYKLLVEIADEEILKRLKNGFSGLVEFSKEVEVLDWEPEFAIHDRTPTTQAIPLQGDSKWLL